MVKEAESKVDKNSPAYQAEKMRQVELSVARSWFADVVVMPLLEKALGTPLPDGVSVVWNDV